MSMIVDTARFPSNMVQGGKTTGITSFEKRDIVIHQYPRGYKDRVAFVAEPPKTSKSSSSSSISPLRRFFFPLKGRRKEKDSTSPIQDEQKLYLHEDYSQEKILDCEVSWERLVELPQDLDKNEWLATHTISFFDHVNLMYGTVSEFCTSSSCSSMLGPNSVQYLWIDEKGKKCKCAAPQYVEYVMTYVQKTITDESVFPTKYGNVFPATFEVTVKKIHRLLFHVIAHIYQSHYKQIAFVKLHPHLNTLFLHFIIFSRKFNLVDEKETEVLDDLHRILEQTLSVRKTSLSDSGMNDVKQTSSSGLQTDAKEDNKENVHTGADVKANSQ